MSNRVFVGAVILGAILPRLSSAQYPRLAPPPPCSIPRGGASPIAIDGPYYSRGGGTTLAVFPFEHDIDDAGRAHVPWALQEGLSIDLAANPKLRVMTPSSVARALSESGGQSDSAASMLRAQYVLTGRVTQSKDRQDVVVMLHRPGDSTPVWKASFSSAWTLKRMENAITGGVQRALFRELETEALTARGRPTNDAAYEAVAAGDYALLSGTLSGAESARVAYERALQLDPQSPVAATRLAHAYVLVLERGGKIPDRTNEAAMNRVLGLTTGALAADPSLSQAWTVRAMLARLRDPIRFAEAATAHSRAEAAGPNDADAAHEYGVTLMRLGDDRSAEAHFRRALAIEPNRAATLSELSVLALRGARWPESCVFSNASIVVWPYDPLPYAIRARTRLRLGQARDAYADAETAARVTTGAFWVEALRVLVQTSASDPEGGRGQARALTGRWLAPGRTLDVRDAEYVAMAYVATGDNRRAIEALRRARPVGTDLGRVIRDNAALAPIRSDTAVARLLRETAAQSKPSLKPKSP